MVKRKIYSFRNGEILEIEEHHDGRYGGPGKKRLRKKEKTKEEMQKVNAQQKIKRCRHRLLEYFSEGDLFATLTYKVEERPEEMKDAIADFQKAMRQVRKEYKKQERELFWIRNIERGTKGAWHIHIIINQIGNTEHILKEAWKHGGVYVEDLKDNKNYSKDMGQIAAYMCKDQHTTEKKKDGTESAPRLKESSYSTSRNMPLAEPKVRRIIRWTANPKQKKGYTIEKVHEGINPVTGFLYRRYTMSRIGGEKHVKNRYLHSTKLTKSKE